MRNVIIWLLKFFKVLLVACHVLCNYPWGFDGVLHVHLCELFLALISLQASLWVQNMTGGADFDAEEAPEDDDAGVRPMR